VRRSACALAVASVCALAAGCGAPAGEGDVRRTAADWLAAAEAGDAARLCALLAPAAAESAATGDETCEQAVGDLDLPGGRVGRVELWSDEAQVRAGTDTLFLVRLAGGWRVTAAGCTPRGDQPYDCDVAG
jgi:ketosteroid isomerase-like protein